MSFPFLPTARTALLCVLGLSLITSAACARETGAPDAPATAQKTAPAATETAQAQSSQPAVTPAAETSPAEPAFDESKIPAVVARVNGEEVTRDELIKEADGARSQLARRGMPDEATHTADFYHRALNEIVAGILLYDEAKAKGLLASKEEIDKQLAAFKAQAPPGQDFDKTMEAMGMTPEAVREDIRRSLSIQKVFQSEVLPKVKVDDAAIESFYKANLEHMKRPEQVKVRHILVKVDKDATSVEKGAAKGKAEALRKRIAAGEDFAKVAKESSDDTGSAKNGGELPWLSPGQAVTPFDKAAFALEKGQISNVVETPFGYHIIQLEDRRPASTVPLDEAKDTITKMLQQRQAEAQFRARVEELKSAGKVEIFL